MIAVINDPTKPLHFNVYMLSGFYTQRSSYRFDGENLSNHFHEIKTSQITKQTIFEIFFDRLHMLEMVCKTNQILRQFCAVFCSLPSQFFNVERLPHQLRPQLVPSLCALVLEPVPALYHCQHFMSLNPLHHLTAFISRAAPNCRPNLSHPGGASQKSNIISIAATCGIKTRHGKAITMDRNVKDRIVCTKEGQTYAQYPASMPFHY